jgi:hypothetical protein
MDFSGLLLGPVYRIYLSFPIPLPSVLSLGYSPCAGPEVCHFIFFMEHPLCLPDTSTEIPADGLGLLCGTLCRFSDDNFIRHARDGNPYKAFIQGSMAYHSCRHYLYRERLVCHSLFGGHNVSDPGISNQTKEAGFFL